MGIGLFVNILLALFALYQWKKGNKAVYLAILQFMIFQSYRLRELMLSPIRSDDLALLLVLTTTFINYSKGKILKNKLIKYINLFLVFLLLSSLVSLCIKEIPLMQVIKGVRGYFFILAFYDIFLMKMDELKKSIHLIFLINVFFSFIFIIQTFIPSIQLLSDDINSGIRTGFLGLRRFYSYPALLPFACLYSIYLFPKGEKYKGIYIIICLFTLLLVQSRGMIMYTGALIIISSFIFKSNIQNKIIYFIISLFIIFIIKDTIFKGDTGNKTTNDFELIMSGDIDPDYKPEGDATLAFRTWLFLVRSERMLDGDIWDKIFGLGLFIQLEPYKARLLGLSNIGNTYSGNFEMFTPDISYANHIAYLGYVGTILYLLIFVVIFFILFKEKKNNSYAKMGFLYIIFLLSIGINSSSITYSGCLIVPFIFYRLSYIEWRILKFKQKAINRIGSVIPYYAPDDKI